MCGIAGFFNGKENYKDGEEKWVSVLKQMNREQKHRGPDEDGIVLGERTGSCKAFHY